MPIFIAALLGGFVSAAGSVVGRVLIALSIGYVTYTGLSTGLDWFVNQFYSELSSAPAMFLQIIGLLQVDTAINILSSAYASKLVINGLTSGAITKMVIK